MKTRVLVILVIVTGFSTLSLLFLFENPSESNMSDGREDLKEVVYASTPCSTYWRTNLFDIWENKTHDYKNDPIFQECYQGLEFKSEPEYIPDLVVKHNSIPSAQEFLRMGCEDLNHLYPEFPSEEVADAWITRMHECLNEQENED